MAGSGFKAGSVGLIVGSLVVGSVLHALGNTNPTQFQACLTPGGALTLVTTATTTLSCPGGTTLVSWGQQGPPGQTGGLTATREITSSTNFTVPAGVTRLMVEAWGAGGGGSDALPFPDCSSGGSGGGGGYLRTVLAVTPSETLSIVVGAGGGPGIAGGASAIKRGTSVLVSAGGGGAASATPGSPAVGGSGGQVVSAGGIARNGNGGGGGATDSMCQFGPGNPPGTDSGIPGAPIQGSVGLPNSDSTGGRGADYNNNFVAQPGGAGDVILSW